MNVKAVLDCCVLCSEERSRAWSNRLGRASQDQEGGSSSSRYWEEGGGLIREGWFCGRTLDFPFQRVWRGCDSLQ